MLEGYIQVSSLHSSRCAIAATVSVSDSSEQEEQPVHETKPLQSDIPKVKYSSKVIKQMQNLLGHQMLIDRERNAQSRRNLCGNKPKKTIQLWVGVIMSQN